MKNTNNSGMATISQRKLAWKEKTGYLLLELLLGMAFGLLLPRASVYGGFMPFGVGFAAAAGGAGTVLLFTATLFGYLLQGSGTALRYTAALIAVAGIRWSVSGFKRVTQTCIFPAAVAFVSTLITGSALLLTDKPGLLSVLTIIAESFLAGGFSYFASHLFHTYPTNRGQALSYQTQIAYAVVLAVTMMALFNIEWGGISPGRIAAAYVVLLAGRCGKLSGGCSVGILMGVSLLLTAPQNIYLANAYALGGLLSALYAKKGKLIPAVLLLVSVTVVSVLSGNEITVLLSVYESLSACILFLLTPPLVEASVEGWFFKGQPLPEVLSARQGAAFKLDCAAKAMVEVAGTVDAVSEQLSGLGAPELGSAYRRATDTVCRSCKQKLNCWETHFQDTMDSLNCLTPTLQRETVPKTEDLSGYLSTHCIHPQEILRAVVAGYREYTVRESAFCRLQELRSVVNDQFSGTAQLLRELSLQFYEPEYFDTDTENKVRATLEKQNITLQNITCRVNSHGRMVVELSLAGNYESKNAEAFCKKIGEICGRSFSAPVLEHAAGTTRVSFSERHAFRVKVGFSQIVCKGEKLCGDAVELFEDSNGRQVAVLSDGMGSGGGAAVDSAMAAGLAVRMIKAGFGYESMLKMINTALMVKSEDESLATLDIAVINLFTGDLEILKAGAGASLLFSRERISYLADSSLPLGILHELTFARTKDRLVDGDILIIMSDGVSNGECHWLENTVRDYNIAVDTPQELSRQIAVEAQKHQGENEKDDITVVVLQVEKV